MKSKRFLICVLSVISLLCLLGSCTSITGKNFENETQNVQYGTVYELDSVKTDKDGTVYELQAEVFNSKNQPVAVFGGKFDVLDVNGYTVKYTAYNDGKKIGEWIIVLKVDENILPTLKFTSYAQTNTHEIGDNFKLPTTLAYSVVDNNVTETKKLYKLVNSVRTEVEFENGIFKPTESGEYIYCVTAIDGKNRSNSLEYSFKIRQAPKTTELESFDAPESIINAITKTGDISFEGLNYCGDEIGGVVGSLKLTAKNNWPLLYLKSRQDINASEYPWISFKIYVDSTGLEDVMKRVIGVYDANNGQSRNNVVNCGQWVEVYTSTENFLTSMDENGYGLLFSINNDSSNGYFRVNKEFTAYLTDVHLLKAHTVSNKAQLIDISKDDVLQNLHANYTYSWDYGFDIESINAQIGGQEGSTIKLTAHNIDCSHPNLYAMPVNTLQYYKSQGYTQVEIPIYIDGSTLPQGRITKKFSFWKVDGSADDMHLPVNTWITITRSLDDLFSKNDKGYISLFQMDNSQERDLDFVVYVGNIQAK